MKSYCLKCKKNTENINPRVSNTSNGKTMLLSKCAKCGSKKSKFIKNQEAKGLLSNLSIITPLSKVPLLAGDKFMPEMHLSNQGLLIVLVNHLLKTRKEFKNLMKQEIQAIFTK